MQIQLNRELFYVEHNEFPLLEHHEYTTLKIYPQLGILEREISLIKEIINTYNKNTTFINIELSHGGFVPIKLLPFVDNIKIVTTNINQINNFTKNCEMYDTQQKIIIFNNIYELVGDNNLSIIKFDLNFDFNNILNMASVLNNIIVLSYKEIELKNHKCYKLTNSELIVYVPSELINLFENNFKYYLNFNVLDYDNLLHLCMIVKNAGDGFKEILESNIDYIDEWTVLDTGSTDDTINIINEVLKNKKGKLYEEPFINFRDSRNRCLELAGQNCKFIIMLDDTYVLKGNVRSFLELIRGEQFADSYNIFVNSKDTVYGSNRLLKADRQLKYIYKIHEIIQNYDNVVVQCPIHEIFIGDINNEYMIKRTMDRKQSDLKLLNELLDEQPNVPRTLYYLTQTYCELQLWDLAFEYANKRINHPIKGYEEEITECHLIMGNIAESIYEWSWDKCEELYIKCYNHDSTRADALYCIGLHYSTLDINKSYKYLKQAFELGTPLIATSNLRPHIYNKLIPQLLIPICYQMDDYVLGEMVVEKYLKFNKPNETILSYSSIFKLLIKNNEYSQLNKLDRLGTNKDILCFVADGGFKNWSGNSLNVEGVGGSETYIIEMSKYIAKLTNYKVYVFCKTNDMGNSEMYENVKYKNLNKYIKFLNRHKIHTCIISRFSEYIPVTLKNDVGNLYLVVHDLLPSGNIIPLNDKLKGIFCMSDWHKEYFLNSFPMLKDITHVFPNGINVNKYNGDNCKKPNSFIYSSFPNRGLLNLLKMFPKIREKLPGATLNVFCDTKNKWCQTVAGDDMMLIDELLVEQKEYVINHGFVPKDILIDYFLQTDIWLYPCTFMETFCVTALEAAISNTLCVTNNLGALIDTVGERGIIVDGDANSLEWQDLVINELINVLNDLDKKNNLVMRNRKWAENYDWEKLAQDMVGNYIGLGREVNFVKYYGPIQENIDYLCERFSHCKKVLEIGPGNVPFPLSTHFIDHRNLNNLPNLTIIDITKDKLPFEDDEFDLVYCRHVLEDIRNPEYVIGELSRVGKIMYFETPSPLAEVTRHIDGSSPYYRGYIHHSSMIWENNGELNILTKYPVLEYIDVPNYFEKLGDPYFWNTYFIWDKSKSENDKIKVNVLKYDIDYNLHTEYEKMVKLSIGQSNKSIKMYKMNINMRKRGLEYCGMLNWSSDVPKYSGKIFESILDRFVGKNCNILEIGTYTGTSIVSMLKYLPGAIATVIDMWEDYGENQLLVNIRKNNVENIFYNNLVIGNVVDRVNCIKGDSKDILVKLLSNNIKYDFIYVDGSHKCLDCYSDMVLSWNLLKSGGVLGVDDYLWKPENSNSNLDSPYYAVNHFMERYEGTYIVLDIGYRVFLLKK